MPKADPHHNYYADLEVSEKADTEEIKRAYRKLGKSHPQLALFVATSNTAIAARLWHPDRNPGKENEVISKFQLIQTAQEILTDPELRNKYDNDRRKRAGYGGTYGRSPSARYSSGPVPRPQPTNARNTRPDFANPSASNGANRFSRFPRPPPQTSAQADAEARANNYNAWQNLGARKQHQPQPQGQAQGQPQTGPFGSRTRPPASEEERLRQQRTAWEQFKKAHQYKSSTSKAGPGPYPANTAKTHQKPGFDPSTPGADEPQAKNTSSYFHSFPGQQTQGSSQSQYTRAPPPTAKKPPNSNLRPKLNTEVPYSEGEPRLSTPYASHSGEKTYFSGDALRRSASHRDPSRRPDINGNLFGHTASRPSTGTSPRARSASPKRRSSYGTQQANSATPQSPSHHFSTTNAQSPTPNRGRAGAKFYMSSSDNSEERVSSDTNRRSRGDDADPTINHRPKAQPSPSWAKNRTKSADQQPGGTSLPRSNDAPGMQQKSNSSMYDKDFISDSAEWSTYWPFGSKPKPQGPVPKPPSWAYPSSIRPPVPTSQQKHGHDVEDILKDAFSTKASGLYPSCDIPNQRTSKHRHCPSEDDWPKFASSSDYARDPDTGCITMPLELQIRLNYLQSKLEFRSDRDTDENSKSSFDYQPNGFAANAGSETRSKSSENMTTRFSTSDWHGKFTGDTFAHRPASGNAANTGAQMQNPFGPSSTYAVPPPPPDRPSQTKTTPVFPPAPGEVKFSAEEWAKTYKDGSWVYPQPPMKSTSPVRKQTTKPRASSKSTATRPATIPKPVTINDATDEPTAQGNGNRSADADGSDGSAMDIDVEEPKPNTRGPRMVHVPPLRPEWRDSKPTSAPATGVNKSNGGLDLAGFSNVAPFAPSEAGLKDLNDLRSQLPFESQASAVHPRRTVSQSQNTQIPTFSATLPASHVLPAPPKPPPAPTPLTPQSWREYVARMQAYLAEWNRFEKAVTARFTSHQGTLDALLSTGSTAWLEGGNEHAKQGCNAYVQELKQDEQVREHWAVASEAHRETMKIFLNVREQVLQSGL
jgi:curved DNA-binding protein CbpA